MKKAHLTYQTTLGIVAMFALLFNGLECAGQTELYKRYANVPNVKVASVSNFAIDSTSQVDVTVIMAEDDEGWDWMKQEFFIGDLSPEQQAGLREGNDAVLFARRSRSNPRENAPLKRTPVQGEATKAVDEQIDIAESCYIGISYLNQAVYVFCADSEEQYDAVVTLLVKKIMRGTR